MTFEGPGLDAGNQNTPHSNLAYDLETYRISLSLRPERRDATSYRGECLTKNSSVAFTVRVIRKPHGDVLATAILTDAKHSRCDEHK